MGKEHVVDIKGHKYRYVYNEGNTEYRGPVGDAPSISEADFLKAMGKQRPRLTEQQIEVMKVIKLSIVPPHEDANIELTGYGVEREKGGYGVYHPWYSDWGDRKQAHWAKEPAMFEIERKEPPYKITRTVESMEKKGLIEIVYNYGQGANYGINITDLGKEILKEDFMGPTAKPNWPRPTKWNGERWVASR
jgi:hypothetical protein